MHQPNIKKDKLSILKLWKEVPRVGEMAGVDMSLPPEAADKLTIGPYRTAEDTSLSSSVCVCVCVCARASPNRNDHQ
jgi:hypothetical protein